MEQLVMTDNFYTKLDIDISSHKIKKILLICGKSLEKQNLYTYFFEMKSRIGVETVIYNEYEPNPRLEIVEKAIDMFNREKCDAVIAIGGGSIIDIAKCVRISNKYDYDNREFNNYSVSKRKTRLYVIPTTAGSGSEATKYAVIYKNNCKMSISDAECIPDVVCFETSVLKSLPDYHKKSSLLDAWCQTIESIWSINATKESNEYAVEGMQLILKNYKGYLMGDEGTYKNIQKAAYMSGKAINITQTTSGHAMSYKLTSLYGIAHGHAVGLCISKIWPYMYDKVKSNLNDFQELSKVFELIAQTMGEKSVDNSILRFTEILKEMELDKPNVNIGDIDILASSVNKERLKNNPIVFNKDEIRILYNSILNS